MTRDHWHSLGLALLLVLSGLSLGCNAALLAVQVARLLAQHCIC